MKITLKTTGMEVAPALRQYAEKKLGKLEKFLGNFGAAEAWVEIAKTTRHHRSGAVWRAEADIRLPRKIVRAAVEGLDPYAAVDEIHKDLFRAIEKYRQKRFLSEPRSSLRKSARRARGKD